jgi:hypothetical protein
MQGATVEQTTIVASPHDLSRGWSYTALSRARGHTRLLIRDGEPSIRGRHEYAPAGRTLTHQHDEVLGRVGRQMLVRDDEDLAIDQLAAAGRPDDPQLAHAAVEPLLEQTTTPGESPSDSPVRSALGELRDQLERLRAQLAALPTAEIESLDALDARARELTERRDLLRGELERLPISRERRFARTQDPHLVDRTRLTSALAGTEDQLERTLTQRATLARELGDPAAIREERDGLTSTIDTLAHQHAELRNQLADLEVQHRPEWARDALGERPDRTTGAESWDRAARTLARYRIEYETPEHADPLATSPTDPHQRDDYQRALRTHDQLAHQLGRQTPGHQLDIDR